MDCLRKAISADREIEFIAIEATDLLRESMLRTGAWPPAMIHLGQALMGAELLGAITTKEQTAKIGIQWNVRGPFGNLYAEADHMGRARGTIVHPQAPVQNLNSTLGSGVLKVFRKEKGFVTGIVNSKGDVCADLLKYLKQSEQRFCAMNLWVDLTWNDDNPENPVEVRNALGYLVESLPSESIGRAEAKAVFWEGRLDELGSISKWQLEDDKTKGILKTLSGDENVREIFYLNVGFHCDCDEDRARRALALARNDTTKKSDFVKSESQAETLRCEYCGKEYCIE
jgi:redox-regulated HSP33 family molecular chaperone